MLAIDNRVWYNYIKLRDGGKHYEHDKRRIIKLI